MRRPLFSQEGPLWSLLDRCGQLVILSVMWFLGCLPVVTLGTSTAALYYAVMKSVRRGRGTPWKEFLRSYRANLGRGILSTVLAGGIFLLLTVNLRILGEETSLLRSGNRVLLLTAAACCVYICPVLSRFSLSVRESWRLAFVMALRFLPATVLLLAGGAGLALLQIYVLPIPALLILPGLGCLGSTYLCERGLRRFMPEKKEQENAWYYE